MGEILDVWLSVFICAVFPPSPNVVNFTQLMPPVSDGLLFWEYL